MSQIPFLDEAMPCFPATHTALDEPNGLLAAGGNLSASTLVSAYQQGIFPWFSEGQPILWWTPSPRMVLDPAQAYFNRSLKKLARKRPFRITVDCAFDAVVEHCATTIRPDQDGTWIDNDMQMAYAALHAEGVAHSIEAWQDEQLVGGLYGLAIGGAFFGESMFSHASGASKMCFSTLCMQLQRWGYSVIDCQIYTDYLASFGADEISRTDFEQRLDCAIRKQLDANSNWQQHWEMESYGFDGCQ